MQTIILGTNGIGSGVLYAATSLDTNYVVEPSVLIRSADEAAFHLVGNDHSVIVRDYVTGESGAAVGGSYASTGSLIRVEASGNVLGFFSDGVGLGAGAALKGAETPQSDSWALNRDTRSGCHRGGKIVCQIS